MVKVDFYETLYDVELVDPDTIKAKINETDIDYSYFELNKSVIKFLYGSEGVLKIPYKTSKKLFEDVDEEYWKSFIDEKISSSNFDFKNYKYIAMDGMLLEIVQPQVEEDIYKVTKEGYEKLFTKINELDNKKEMFDLDRHFEKILINCEENEDFTNVIAIEMDYKESRYSLTAGIIVDKLMWFHTKKNLDEKDLINFFTVVDLEDEIGLANKFGQALYKDYAFDLKNENLDKTLSLAELFTIFKHNGIGVEYVKERKSPDYGIVTELKHIDEWSIIGSRIIDNINSYDTPYKSLKRLLALEKSFKDSGISFKEMLMFMYQEYFNINILVDTSEIISLRNKITKRKNDFNIIKEEVQKLGY